MKTYSAEQIARYFLAKADADVGELVSNLKLQKLCYYAQGLGLAVRGNPMFLEPIEAWLHGPVVPALYQRYRDYRAQAIPAVSDLDVEIYDPADRMLLDDVFDYYGQYSAWRLREMTHEESPWKSAYVDGMNNLITLEALKAFFLGEVTADYTAKYEQISRG